MITDAKAVDSAKAFAEKFKPSEGDHPDLHSRVVMFRRAVEGKDDRHIQAHARSLVRFLAQVGVDIPKPAKKAAAKKSTAKKAASSSSSSSSSGGSGSSTDTAQS